METWYRAKPKTYYRALKCVEDCISTVHVDRHTESSVWINGKCHRRMTDFDCYFETFQEARDYVLGNISAKLLLLDKQSLMQWLLLNRVCGIFGVDVNDYIREPDTDRTLLGTP